MFIQSVNDFHPLHAFLHEEHDNVRLLHFHDKIEPEDIELTEIQVAQIPGQAAHPDP
jgi:hypothetical protein